MIEKLKNAFWRVYTARLTWHAYFEQHKYGIAVKLIAAMFLLGFIVQGFESMGSSFPVVMVGLYFFGWLLYREIRVWQAINRWADRQLDDDPPPRRIR